MLQSGQASEAMIVETLVEEHSASLYRLALSLLDDPDSAHKAVVRTFQGALRDAHRYRSDLDVKLWLFQLALQACRKLAAGLRARRALQAAVPNQVFSPYPGAPLPETETEALPLLLHDVHGLSDTEIARVLGLPAVGAGLRPAPTRPAPTGSAPTGPDPVQFRLEAGRQAILKHWLRNNPPENTGPFEDGRRLTCRLMRSRRCRPRSSAACRRRNAPAAFRSERSSLERSPCSWWPRWAGPAACSPPTGGGAAPGRRPRWCA
jgi:DNA-directed RNA polymerase specialized sigma24 family protein